MPPTRSRWRAIADRVVNETLLTLPPGATLEEKRKALRDAYPFGQRAMLPYRHWLKAVRAGLGLTTPSVFFVLRSYGPLGNQRLLVAVACGMCEGFIEGGCIACLRHVQRVRDIVSTPQWVAFQTTFDTDPRFALVAASDWLQERGFIPLKTEDRP